ncbi:MAG: cytochrome B6 [Anaerolineaceae bacterium]|nr:cytochrome B6 [Anaerolineaceae bacterium]
MQNTKLTWIQKILVKDKKERKNIVTVANNLVMHLHPARVPAAALDFKYTWGLGGISTVLVVLLGLTGLLLMFRYDARVDYAYLSIQALETQIQFGSLIRAVHHWSANLLVITTALHLLRVFFTGSYKQGRSTNWIIGLVLFFLALISNFTGYLLPWDQLAYWAITVSTNLMSYIPVIGFEMRNFFLGGPQVGQNALSNFYALHVVFVPFLLIIILSYHFWKVRKNGGISQPIQKENQRVSYVQTLPNLVRVEYAAALVVIVVIVLWSMIKPAPLGPIANPFNSPNPAKAAWYFLGLQELLLHMQPLAVLGLVAVLGGVLVLTPFFDKEEEDIGLYFRSPVGKRAAMWGALLGLNLTPIIVLLDEYWIDLLAWMPGVPASISTGWVPFLTTLMVMAVIYAVFRSTRVYQTKKANHSEAVLGVFAFIVVALLVLTAIGIFFRGPNMAFVLPF